MFVFLHCPSIIEAAKNKKSAKCSSKLIQKICKEAQDNHFCTKVLFLNRHAKRAKTTLELAEVALDLAIEHSTNTLNFIQEMLKNRQTNPFFKRALQICASNDAYVYAINSFKSSRAELNDAMTANYDASLVSDAIKVCEDAMTPPKGVSIPSIVIKNNYVSKLSSIVVAVTNALQNEESDDGT